MLFGRPAGLREIPAGPVMYLILRASCGIEPFYVSRAVLSERLSWPSPAAISLKSWSAAKPLSPDQLEEAQGIAKQTGTQLQDALVKLATRRRRK